MPKRRKKMLVQRARFVYWKKWAAMHEHEELKRERGAKGVRKIFLEGGWTQKRLFDIGWSDTSQ